jgi:hypothetical protein
VEFETLTGMSLGQFAPQLTTPYQMLVPDYAEFPSAARYFAAHGHRAVALHPFLPQLYRRQEVYPVLGFERFIDRSAMRHTARIEHGVHVSDAAAFREAQDLIAAHRSPLLLNLVTMQNHGPYHDQYTDPIPVRNLHGDAAREGGDYLRGLQHSDDAMRDFIRELSRSKEKTLVIFYGDHAPGFWPPAVRIANGDRRMKETPYFIWSNFTRNEPVARPTTSPVYLLPRALDAVDAPVPAYYALLLELADEVPAMGLGSYIDTSDKPSNEADLSARGRALLRDYRLVQYDLSIGERYAERALYAMPPSSSEQASASAE